MYRSLEGCFANCHDQESREDVDNAFDLMEEHGHRFEMCCNKHLLERCVPFSKLL